MSTAKTVAQAAAQYIGVKRIGVDLSEDELQEATDMLRDMLVEWSANGIKLPFNIPMKPTDEIDELDWTTSYFKLALANRLCLNYTIEPTMNLVRQYRSAKNAVLSRITDMGPMQKPSTLPIGTGNDWFGTTDRRYYPDLDAEAIATGSGNTLLDDEGETIVRDDPYNNSIIKGK